MTNLDLVEVLERLGRGTQPEALAVARLETGYLDLRRKSVLRARTLANACVAGATFDYRPGRPIVSDCRLKKVDLSESDLTDLSWETPYELIDAKFERVRGIGQTFRPGFVESASFRDADLRESHWGVSGKSGPVFREVDFSGADLRGSTFGHPLFERCNFTRARLDGIDFNGSRFEECIFAGALRQVRFNGRGRGNEVGVAGLQNSMKNVDFTRANLEFVEFLSGLDLTTCKFPEQGYYAIRNPKRVFQQVRERVARWTDKGRDKALRYLGWVVDYKFKEEVPLDVMRPEDLSQHSELRGIGPRILEELESVLKGQ